MLTTWSRMTVRWTALASCISLAVTAMAGAFVIGGPGGSDPQNGLGGGR